MLKLFGLALDRKFAPNSMMTPVLGGKKRLLIVGVGVKTGPATNFRVSDLGLFRYISDSGNLVEISNVL